MYHILEETPLNFLIYTELFYDFVFYLAYQVLVIENNKIASLAKRIKFNAMLF